MINLLKKRKGFLVAFLIIVLTIPIFWFIDVRDLCAHSPHDPIDALAISPNYDRDRTLYIAMSDHLLKSTDGGSSWKELVNGLDNLERFSSIAIAPSYALDGTLFVSSAGDGIYRSQNRGSSWAKVNNGLDTLNVNLLSIHPDYHASRIVLAAATEGGLYRTENGGDGWDQVMDDGIRITALAFSPDLSRDDAVAGDNRGQLYVSKDGGRTWRQTRQISNAGAITSIAIPSGFSSDGTLFVGTERSGVLKTTDGGDSFAEANKGMPFTFRAKYATFRTSGGEGPMVRRDEKVVLSLALSPDYEADATVFAALWNQAVFKSSDGGRTWTRYPLGLTCDIQADSEEYKSPHFRDLGVSPAFAKDGTIFLGGFDGLFKSTDGGRRWLQMETLPLRLIKGLAVSPGERDSSSLAIITYGGGAYTTCDQGATWAVNNKELDRTRLSDIVFSPAYRSDNIILSASKGYILVSTDRGQNWSKTELLYNKDWTTPLKRRASALLKRAGIPSYLRGWILAKLEREAPYTTVLAVSPNFAADGTLYFGTRLHGVYRSADGGLSASAVWDGMGRLIRFLAISPDFASDQTLYASVRGMGVYKTADGGQTWQPANSGLTFVKEWQSRTAHDRDEQDVQLVISPNYRTDRTVFAASTEGLFKTTDGGDNWQKLESLATAGNNYVIGLAISPNYTDDGTLLVSTRGEGLFKTDNGGETFTALGSSVINDDHAIELIVFSVSYLADATIYAASKEELFLSTDRGATWEVIDRPVRYENMREVVRYEGEWQIATGEDFSASNVSYADAAHSKATLTFVGTGITWIGTRGSDQGIGRVYIDGNHVGDVDQFDDARRTMVESFLSTDLVCGPHTIEVEVADIKDPRSTGYRVEIDAFDILQEQGCR